MLALRARPAQVRALEELRGNGDIAAFGAGINHTGTMTRYMVRPAHTC
jgi:hypothetical protein